MSRELIELGNGSSVTIFTPTTKAVLTNTMRYYSDILYWSTDPNLGASADGWRELKKDEYITVDTKIYLRHTTEFDAQSIELTEGGGDAITTQSNKIQLWASLTETLPPIGEVDKLYLDTDTGRMHKWRGAPKNAYEEVAPLDDDDNVWIGHVKADKNANTIVTLGAGLFENITGTLRPLKDSAKTIVEINSVYTDFAIVGDNKVRFKIPLFAGDVVEVKER